MRILALALLCSLACAGCAKPLTTLSDGQPGYAVNCETVRQRCLDEIARLCGNKSHMILTERAREVWLPLDWLDSGATFKFNSRYWMEVRCD